MPWTRSKYPENWKEIRARIQSRAGDRCERCGVKNHACIARSVCGKFWYDLGEDCYFHYPSGERIEGRFEADLREKNTNVVCTTAHIGAPHADGRPGNKHDKADCRDENLQFLCQACHLAEDLDDHIRNRKRSQMAKKAAGSLF